MWKEYILGLYTSNSNNIMYIKGLDMYLIEAGGMQTENVEKINAHHINYNLHI